MASKKKSTKNPIAEPQTKGDSQSKGLLGGKLNGKLNGIAVALLTALVTEIVQQVIERLFSSHDHSNSADDQSDAAASNSPTVAKNHAEVDQSETDLENEDLAGEDIGTEDEPERQPAVVAAASDRIAKTTAKNTAQTKPLVEDVLQTIRSTIEEATPRLNEAIGVLQASSNDPQKAVATLVRNAVTGTRDNLQTAADTAKPDLDSWINHAIGAAQSVVEGVAENVPGVDLEKSKQKGKKKKGKKKKGKKAKK